MPSLERRRILVAGWVLLALVGLWLGHTVEYVRVWGTRGLDVELFGSIHAYMLPLAAVLALLASLLALRLWHAWETLGCRLDDARARLWCALRGRRDITNAPSAVVERSTPSFWGGVASAWPILALLQVGLYLIQENIEAIAGGAPAPGMGAITGAHGLAPLVHAVVSLALLAWAAAIIRLLRRRADAIDAVESLVRALRVRLRALLSPLPPSRNAGPLELLFGSVFLQRPPPSVLFA